MDNYDGVNRRSNEQKAYIGDMVHVSFVGKVTRVAKVADKIFYYVDSVDQTFISDKEAKVLAEDIQRVQEDQVDVADEDGGVL